MIYALGSHAETLRYYEGIFSTKSDVVSQLERKTRPSVVNVVCYAQWS